uniref:Uncharacterized protein n=1 Tax=Schistocephalus solidus TaxID=70667 RepID=A0A0X3NXV6_SCHSO
MSFVIWLIYVCYASAQTEFNVHNVNVRKDTDFEFVTVVSASSAVPQNTIWATGTLDNPCESPWACIQFYPSKRSVLISGNLKNGYAAITLYPENPNLPIIAVVLVEGNVWAPNFPNVQFIKSIDLSRDLSDKRILVFDEDIQAITLHGEIIPFSDRENGRVLKLQRPYDPNRSYQRKFMRVTGKMETNVQTLTLAVGPGINPTYKFLPTEESRMPKNVVEVLVWPKRSFGSTE